VVDIGGPHAAKPPVAGSAEEIHTLPGEKY